MRGEARPAGLEPLSAVEDRPADVVAQLLVVQHEAANVVRKMITLPLTLDSSGSVGVVVRNGSTSSLDRVSRCAEVVGGDMRHGTGLAGRIRGMPCRTTLVPRRTHGMTARCTRFHHRDLAPRPGADVLDGLARSWVPRVSEFEQVNDVLCAGSSPQRQQMVI